MWNLIYLFSSVIVIIWLALQFYLSYYFKKANNVTLNTTGADLLNSLKKDYDFKELDIRPVEGTLSDHFMPWENYIWLSNESYYGSWVGALAVSLHEFWHALQHKENSLLAKIHSKLFPVMRFASIWSIILWVIGAIFNFANLFLIWIICFWFVVIYYISLTFLEYDASKRGYEIALQRFDLNEEEKNIFKKTLFLAFLTYFLSLVQAILQLIQMIYQYKKWINLF